MKHRFSTQIWLAILVITLILQACSGNQPAVTPTAAPTNTPQPPKSTSTATAVPSATAGLFALLMPTKAPNLTATHRTEAWNTSQAGRPLSSTRTPGPTRTPNMTATTYVKAWKTSLSEQTEVAYQNIEKWNAEAQNYFELGYLKTSEGELIEYDDFSEEWAQLGWYTRWTYSEEPADFYMSGHLKWSSAYRSADISGCGFIFAEQLNGDHYAVFLDRSKVLFVETEYYYLPIGTTRGTGRVKFDNPFDKPAEADFTLIVKDAYAYVLVDGEVVGEYTLSQSKILRGNVGVAILSGTNKDFGTRCEITNLHLWIPND